MARPEGEPSQSENKPSSLRRAGRFLRAPVLLATVVGGSLIIKSTLEGDQNLNCTADAKQMEAGEGDEYTPNILRISYEGDSVPWVLAAYMESRGDICFFDDPKVSGLGPFRLIHLANPDDLHLVKGEFDELVEKGVITSVDFTGVTRAQESVQPTE